MRGPHRDFAVFGAGPRQHEPCVRRAHGANTVLVQIKGLLSENYDNYNININNNNNNNNNDNDNNSSDNNNSKKKKK